MSDHNPGDTHTYSATFVPENGEALLSIDPTSKNLAVMGGNMPLNSTVTENVNLCNVNNKKV